MHRQTGLHTDRQTDIEKIINSICSIIEEFIKTYTFNAVLRFRTVAIFSVPPYLLYYEAIQNPVVTMMHYANFPFHFVWATAYYINEQSISQIFRN